MAELTLNQLTFIGQVAEIVADTRAIDSAGHRQNRAEGINRILCFITVDPDNDTVWSFIADEQRQNAIAFYWDCIKAFDNA